MSQASQNKDVSNLVLWFGNCAFPGLGNLLVFGPSAISKLPVPPVLLAVVLVADVFCIPTVLLKWTVASLILSVVGSTQIAEQAARAEREKELSSEEPKNFNSYQTARFKSRMKDLEQRLEREQKERDHKAAEQAAQQKAIADSRQQLPSGQRRVVRASSGLAPQTPSVGSRSADPVSAIAKAVTMPDEAPKPVPVASKSTPTPEDKSLSVPVVTTQKAGTKKSAPEPARKEGSSEKADDLPPGEVKLQFGLDYKFGLD